MTGSVLVTCVAQPPLIQQSEFDRIIKCRWKEAAEAGLCRYRLDRVQNKVLPGKYGFVVQYNPEKCKPGWRRQCQDFQKVNVPYDPQQFNFNKVNCREILMDSKELNEQIECEKLDALIVINASPLEFGSYLVVPRVTQNISQVITVDGLELLFKLVLLSTDSRLKAGFSSPGGCASVNHQHYHVYYLEEQLYLETSSVEHIAGPCYALTDGYPSKGFAFQLDKEPIQLARHVFTLADYMRQNEIAHNMFITRGTRFESSSSDVHLNDAYDTLRIFIWAREPVFGAKKDYGMNPALCELAGHLLTTHVTEYDAMTEDSVYEILENLTAPWFEKVLPQIPLLFSDEDSDK